MLDWDLKATRDSAFIGYIGNIRQYEIAGYWRYFQRDQANAAARKVAALISRLGITDATSIAIIGGGFGYLQEDFQVRLPGIPIATTDTSAWVQAEKGNTETADLRAMVTGLELDPDAPGSAGQRIVALMDSGLTRATVAILDEDLANNDSRNQVRGEAGLANNQDFDLVISDDVLPTLSDADAVSLSTNMNAIKKTRGLAVHIVTPGAVDGSDQTGGANEDLDYNWHTAVEWRALLPFDDILDVLRFEAAT